MKSLAFVCGLLFGVGLSVSGMADPQKVLAFFDFTARWDPSLAFVMLSALASGLPSFALARRRGRGFTGVAVTLPARWPITAPLITGAAIFGLGWGLSGLCPGPALVLAGGGSLGALVFVAAMAGGMLLSRRLFAPRTPTPAGPADAPG